MHPASFLRLFSSPSSSLSSISQTDRPTLRSTDHYTKNTRWKTSPLILTTPKHSPNLDEIKTHLILLPSDHLFFTRRSCNPSRSTVCTTRRVFLAPFIGRPFFNGPFHHHLAQGKEVEAGTRTNFSGFFSSLPFPPCLIPSSLSFLQLYSLARQKEEEEARRCSGLPPRSAAPLSSPRDFQLRNEECIAIGSPRIHRVARALPTE